MVRFKTFMYSRALQNIVLEWEFTHIEISNKEVVCPIETRALAWSKPSRVSEWSKIRVSRVGKLKMFDVAMH